MKQTRHADRSPYNADPFYLGVEGERWEPKVPGLMVPLPSGQGAILIIKGPSSYAVVTQTNWVDIDELIMVSAFIHERLKADEEAP